MVSEFLFEFMSVCHSIACVCVFVCVCVLARVMSPSPHVSSHPPPLCRSWWIPSKSNIKEGSFLKYFGDAWSYIKLYEIGDGRATLQQASLSLPPSLPLSLSR